MLDLLPLTPGQWVVLLAATFLIGVAKTALPGLVTLSVALYAAVLPARSSTAVMVLLLLAGDVWAVWIYRHDVDWASLRRLVPAVLVGLGAGVLVLWVIDDTAMKRMIGVILLALTAVTLWLMRRTARATRTMAEDGAGDPGRRVVNAPESRTGFGSSPLARWIYGGLGGFTTMVANAGGPPMTLYFMASGFDMWRFLGTQAYFFFLVNLSKVPFQAAMGLHSAQSLTTDLVLLPALLLGAAVGHVGIKRLDPRFFNPIILVLTVVSSAWLLV